MMVEDDADARVVEPLETLYEIRKATAREMFALAIDKVFDYPIAKLKFEMRKPGIGYA